MQQNTERRSKKNREKCLKDKSNSKIEEDDDGWEGRRPHQRLKEEG